MRDDQSLLVAAQSDSLVLVKNAVIGRQRALFAALINKKPANLAEILDIGFKWSCAERSANGQRLEVKTCPSVDRGRPVIPGPNITYFDLMGGYVPPGLDALPAEFEARVISGGAATVTAVGFDQRMIYLTNWRLTPTGWRAMRTDQWLLPPGGGSAARALRQGVRR